MDKVFKNALKAAALWFVTGVLFGLAANAIAPSLGVGEFATLAKTTHALWLGSLLGGTGAIATMATPVMDFLFGDKKPEESKSTATAQSEGRQVNINIQQALSQAQGQDGVDAKFQQNIDAERLAELISPNRTPG